MILTDIKTGKQKVLLYNIKTDDNSIQLSPLEGNIVCDHIGTLDQSIVNCVFSSSEMVYFEHQIVETMSNTVDGEGI